MLSVSSVGSCGQEFHQLEIFEVTQWGMHQDVTEKSNVPLRAE